MAIDCLSKIEFAMGIVPPIGIDAADFWNQLAASLAGFGVTVAPGQHILREARAVAQDKGHPQVERSRLHGHLDSVGVSE